MPMIVKTVGIRNLCNNNEAFAEFVGASLSRFFAGDWGDLCAADKTSNATTGTKYRFAKYNYRPNGDVTKHNSIYIITEHDGSVTTILLPDEY